LNVENLHKEWIRLGERLSKNSLLLDSIWKKIEKKYTGKKRHYHIYSMLQLAEENKNQIRDMDILLFSIWFHDIIYNPSKQNNEEKSADYAKSIAEKFSLKKDQIKKLHQLILSTKSHQILVSKDNAYLLDFDLSILGQNWEIYQAYINNIRKEYSI